MTQEINYYIMFFLFEIIFIFSLIILVIRIPRAIINANVELKGIKSFDSGRPMYLHYNKTSGKLASGYMSDRTIWWHVFWYDMTR